MRTFRKIALSFLLVFIISSGIAFGWTEPVKIVDATNTLRQARLISVGETLYATFCVGPFRLCYNFSRDNGQSWSQPIIFNDTSRHYEVTDPEIRHSKGLLHLLWSETTFYPQIWHSKSSDGGRSWSQPERIFNNVSSRIAFFPSLTVNGDSLFLVCATYDSTGNSHQLIFFRSLDSGDTWGDSMAVEPPPIGVLQPPTLLFSTGTLHLVFPIADRHVDSLGREIYYKRSTDAGLTWSEQTILSPAEPYPHTIASQCASAATDSLGHVLVAWMDYANGSMCGISGDIFYRVSSDNGETWQPYGSITNNQSGEFSSCLILGDKYYVAWNDYWQSGCDLAKEAVSVSSDWGFSWEPREFISYGIRSNDSQPELAATISGNDTTAHCIFYRWSNDPDIAGIYYTRDKDFVGIDEEPIPEQMELKIGAYPNAFNGSTMITFDNPKGGDVRLEIFDILGRWVWHKAIHGKEGNIIWDAKDNNDNGVSSGIYFLRATSGKNICNIRLLYFK